MTDVIAIAERLLEAIEERAAAARTIADTTGDGRALAGLVGRAMLDADMRAELKSRDPELWARLERVLAIDLGREAAIRCAVARAEVPLDGQSMPLHRAFAKYRGGEEAARKGARAVLDRELDRLAEATDVRSWASNVDATSGVEPGPKAAAKPATTSAVPKGIVLATPELIDVLTSGAPLDLHAAEKLVSGAMDVPGLWDSGTIVPAVPAASAQASGVPAETAPRAPDTLPALADLARALAESTAGSIPSTFGAWRAAAAGTVVADFRASRDLPLTALASRARALPFEQPLVPLARRGAVIAADLDASSSLAHLLGVGVLAGDAAIGAALALTAPSRIFIDRGLEERPHDRARAKRTLALSLAMMFIHARLVERAAGDVEALRDYFQDTLDSAPPESIARWWSIEHACSRAPGERFSLYVHSGSPMTTALLRGVSLASLFRESFDEDWFRNPRATIDRLSESAQRVERSSDHAFLEWLRSASSH